VNNTTHPIGGNPAKYALYPHANFYLVRAADNLRGHTRSFIELHDGECVRREGLELLIRSMDYGIRYNRAKSGKLVINNPATSAAVGTKGPRGEEITVTGLTFCPYHVITLGYFSPESCDRHDQTLPRM
jgi:hypothetical protein